jgi:hypothetical protein
VASDARTRADFQPDQRQDIQTQKRRSRGCRRGLGLLPHGQLLPQGQVFEFEGTTAQEPGTQEEDYHVKPRHADFSSMVDRSIPCPGRVPA